MPRRDLKLAIVAAVALASGACETWYNRVPSPDDLMHHVPWFDHMIVQRSVHPYSRVDLPRYTPLGAIPITGSEGDWSTEFKSGKTTSADKLVNPLQAGGTARAPGAAAPALPATIEAEGDTAFHTYCAVCHGSAGNGKGTVQIGAPSLLTPRARGYSDGYIYSIIRYGRGVMPRYGDKVFRPADRWAIVNYVRSLQAAAPSEGPPVAPSGTAATSATAPTPAAPAAATPRPGAAR
ncbi:MAG: cytochrome c [Gemmatimonadota bacterium]